MEQKRYAALRRGAILAQSLMRMQVQRRKFQSKKQSVILLQRVQRKRFARRNFLRMRKCAATVQQCAHEHRAEQVHTDEAVGNASAVLLRK